MVLNLVLNANEAMPEGGSLSITTEDVVLDEMSAAQLDEALRPGAYVKLTVSDTGLGMDENTLRRAFEPFFTTKGPGQNSGLGLSTVYGIVRQNRGWVVAQSVPGEGSSFHVYLPHAEDNN